MDKGLYVQNMDYTWLPNLDGHIYPMKNTVD